MWERWEHSVCCLKPHHLVVTPDDIPGKLTLEPQPVWASRRRVRTCWRSFATPPATMLAMLAPASPGTWFKEYLRAKKPCLKAKPKLLRRLGFGQFLTASFGLNYPPVTRKPELDGEDIFSSLASRTLSAGFSWPIRVGPSASQKESCLGATACRSAQGIPYICFVLFCLGCLLASRRGSDARATIVVFSFASFPEERYQVLLLRVAKRLRLSPILSRCCRWWWGRHGWVSAGRLSLHTTGGRSKSALAVVLTDTNKLISGCLQKSGISPPCSSTYYSCWKVLGDEGLFVCFCM